MFSALNPKITRPNLVPWLKPHATNETVLDVGSGHVETTRGYTEFFPNRHTIDIDEARQPDQIGDIHDLPVENESYSMVVCTEVLEHCHTPQQAVDELYRVLRPGGKLILTTRFVYPLHDTPHDYFRFTKYGLQHLMRNFKTVDITPETETFSAIGALLQRVGFQTILKGGKLSKAFVYGMARVFNGLNWLIKSEYGGIERRQAEDHIMATGYYVVAKK